VNAQRRVTEEEVRTISGLANLPLTEAREAQLARTLSGFLEKFERMRAIDVQHAEPPTLTYESEVRS
jgi:Asp-tRNA(Asn)/Glu-tRNA(Gln) amidotransferase C subunit